MLSTVTAAPRTCTPPATVSVLPRHRHQRVPHLVGHTNAVVKVAGVSSEARHQFGARPRRGNERRQRVVVQTHGCVRLKGWHRKMQREVGARIRVAFWVQQYADMGLCRSGITLQVARHAVYVP